MKCIALLILACSLAGCPANLFAKHKEQYAYRDATLIKFETVEAGAKCSLYYSSADCADTTTRYYTLSVGGQSITVKPIPTHGQERNAMFTMGWSKAFWKNSVLANELPGAHVLIRSGVNSVWIKVGKKESRFEIVAAQ